MKGLLKGIVIKTEAFPARWRSGWVRLDVWWRANSLSRPGSTVVITSSWQC